MAALLRHGALERLGQHVQLQRAADQRRVRFYFTHSQFDMALLLDQLDGTIGVRKREVSRDDA